MRSWLRSSGGSHLPSRPTSLQHHGDAAPPTSPEQVVFGDLRDAMEATAMILNDDIEGAESRLRACKHPSSFHQLALGISTFMRSLLGAEKDMMAETSTRLAEAETQSWSDMKKAQKEGGSGWFRSAAHQVDSDRLFPPGTEYQLIHAETLIMSATVSIMQETISDGVKGFYKLRKAYQELEALSQLEGRILAQHKQKMTRPSTAVAQQVVTPMRQSEQNDSDSSLEFVDAAEGLLNEQKHVKYEGHVARDENDTVPETDTTTDQARPPTARTSGTRSPHDSLRSFAQPIDRDEDAAVSLFTNPMDVFIHSGMNMCFGVLSLFISMVPPAFTRILYIIGFKGDRERGIRMLWQSTKFNNVNGGVAGLLLLSYYNNLQAFADIMVSPHDIRELRDPSNPDDSMVGIPQDQCDDLLARMRARFPDSRLWRFEEARGLANNHKLGEAIALLKTNMDSKMKQVQALNSFELALDSLFYLDWAGARDSMLKCIELSSWSHTLYYYVAGCAELELYRDAYHGCAHRGGSLASSQQQSSVDLAKMAAQHKARAEEYFRKCPGSTSKKRFMGRQMPLEVFVLRKLAKWDDVVKQHRVDLADAIGASPAAEMIWFWSGAKKMSSVEFERVLQLVSWERLTVSPKVVDKMKVAPDEAGIASLLEGTMFAYLGRYDEARTALAPVLALDKTALKGANMDDYVLPAAVYESGVISYFEACDKSTWPEDDGVAVEIYRKQKINECFAKLEEAKAWETYVLDGRIGMRMSPGIDAVRWLRKKKGWA